MVRSGGVEMALYQLGSVTLNRMHTRWLGKELVPGTLAVIFYATASNGKQNGALGEKPQSIKLHVSSPSRSRIMQLTREQTGINSSSSD